MPCVPLLCVRQHQARGGAGLCGHPWKRRLPVRARLLRPAAAPESAGGGTRRTHSPPLPSRPLPCAALSSSLGGDSADSALLVWPVWQPHLSDEIRAQLGLQAVNAARAVNYVGAGTVSQSPPHRAPPSTHPTQPHPPQHPAPPASGAASRRRNGRVHHGQQEELLLHGDEHAPAGRAPDH